jgi:hypothetical protein
MLALLDGPDFPCLELPCFPADLIALQRAAERAEAAFVAYVDQVAAERRALHPGPDQLSERAVWPPAQAAHLDALRAAYAEAVAAVQAHPLIREARERHGTTRILTALRAAASSEAVSESPAGE